MPCVAEILKESCNVLLGGREQHAVTRLDELGKCSEVAQIRLAGKRTQPLFHAQVGLVIPEERQIALGFHTFDYPRGAGCAGGPGEVTVPRSSRNQMQQHG